MTKTTKIIICMAILSLMFIFLHLEPSHAQYSYDYTQLEQIPGFKTSGNDLKAYIESIYQFGIWTVGIAAILMITIGGFMYLTSAGNTSKMDVAKRVVTDALIGLIVALLAYLILYVINPDLIKVNINMKQIGTAGGGTSETCTTACKDKKEGENCSCNNSSGTCDASGTCKVVDACTAVCSDKKEGASCSCNGLTGNCTSGKCKSGEVGGGSCGGLSTQSGIASQCGDASPELSKLLTCIKSKQSGAVISSISDSQGYSKCVNSYQKPPCAHTQYSCHYGGKSCRGKGSYGVDLSTRNLSSSQLKSAAEACGADYALDEGNHVHASVGKSAGCGCN